MTMTAPVPTRGPVDPNVGIRAKLYAGLALVVPLLSFLATLGIVTADQASNVNAILTGLVGLLGAGGLGLAAAKTSKQSKNGTFDAAPAPTAEAALSSLGEITKAVEDTTGHVTSVITQGVATMQGAVAMLPAGGGLLSSVVSAGPVGDFIQGIADHGVTMPKPGEQS